MFHHHTHLRVIDLTCSAVRRGYNFDSQIIVMENIDPLDPLGIDLRDIRFTKHIDVERFRASCLSSMTREPLTP